MRIGLAFLCMGAVGFLSRVLVALLKEWMRLPARKVSFKRSRRRGELIAMHPEVQRREFPRAG